MTGTLTQILPDKVAVDALAGTTTLHFVNNTSSGANFFIFYEYADVQVNEICATITGGTPVIDYSPQLTIWGLSHVGTYNTLAGAYPGWVQHIDSYKSAGERYLVAGLGGNLFAERQREEVGSSHLLPLLYPRLGNRLGVNLVVGPAFVETSPNYYDVNPRTRGYITFTGGDAHAARASTITWNSGTGWVDYVLEVPGVLVNGTLSSILTVNQDYLTVTGAGYKRNEGEFLIKAVSLSGTQLTVSVQNSAVYSSDWNETDSGAQAGVFTDRIEFLNEDEWLPGDELLSNLFPTGGLFVINADATYTYVRNVTSPFNLPAGLRVVARRTSRIVPLRDILGNAEVTNFVIGDSVFMTDVNRALQVHAINPLVNTNVTFTASTPSAGFATVTLGSGTTAPFAQGENVAFFQAGAYSGEYAIESITNGTQFVIASANTANGSGKLLGSALTIDEDLTYGDDVFSRVDVRTQSRWIPIEAPSVAATNTLVDRTYQRHFDSAEYSEQPVLRSTMVQDSMFLTNGVDEVSKYDGVSLYRAGLPRWQPHLFATPNPANPTITVRSDSVALHGTPYTGSRFHVQNTGQEATFTVGDRIRTVPDGNDYTVIAILPDTNEVQVDRAISETNPPTAIGFVNRYRYYFRLNAIDRNQNIVLSATTGANDMIVRLTESASVLLRLVGFPAWDIYDYDLLEVEVYRTKANTVGPFYRVATIPLTFGAHDGYFAYEDTASDEELLDLDTAVTVLKGAELAPALGVPLRAKYVTSAGNRLVLANLTDYAKLTISITGASSDLEIADLQDKRWLFSKNEADTGTTTDNLNRVALEWTLNETAITAISTVANTSFTFETAAAHGLSVGDWVYIYRGTAWGATRSLAGAGWYQVSARTTSAPHTFTVKDSRAPASVVLANGVNRFAYATDKRDVPVSLDTDYNYDVENGGLTTALASPRTFAMRRMANAINAVMRMTDTSLTGQEAFEPWMIASAGAEYEAGQIVVEQPKVFNTFLQVKLPTPTAFTTFVNGVLAPAGSERSARIGLYPSRLIASYANYPETFDAPTATVASESDSAVDVNSADGQEITGVIPFFGDSAFGSAQKDSIIVVFKSNSIYLVNLEAKRQGAEAVQKIDSQGLGCTYPYSIASTRQGIIFANEAGIYRLTRNLTVDYVGRMLERYWDEEVDKAQLLLAQGHNFALGRQYKLSYPFASATANSNVLVYDHTQEYASQQGLGGWTIFTNHPATGWANLDDNAYFGSTLGRVFAQRRAGDATDYRDDDQAIEAVITFRALDFGDAAVRKYLSKIILHLRTTAASSGTKFFISTDLDGNFVELDQFEVQADNLKKVTSLKFSTSKSKFIYLQSKLTNGTIDEGLEVTSIEYRLAGIKDTGLTDAARTRS
jgi:hypothetical protein